MPWNDQKGGWQQGGGGGGRGPWGQGPGGGGGNRGGGGGGMQPPNIEDLMKRGRERLKGMFPNQSPSLVVVALVGGTLLVLWLLTGFYSIQPAEQGIVLRFGQVVDTLGPGFHIRLPQPIETVMRPDIQAENQINIGFRTSDDAQGTTASDLSHESMMLTGDENIIDVDFAVFWRISNAQQFLFQVANVEDVIIKAVAESAMREAVGQNKVDEIQMGSRAKIQDQVRVTTQKVLDSYKAGVTITRVTLQTAQAPQPVIEAFRDVQAATSDQLRKVNEAQRYAMEILPQAKGAAAKIVQDAEGYKQQSVTLAQGEAQRFISIYDQYRASPQVTRERLYIETMQRILAGANKVIVPSGNTGGVLPYMPLPGLQPRASGQPQVTTGGNQ
jgi:modulator of FtsH protease HflK